MDTQTRILLLEDDPAQRLLLAAYLRQAGYEVLEAATLAESRTILRLYPPDLAMLDLSLPDGNGLDLARNLIIQKIPTIVVTSHPADRIPTLELGIDDFLEKPYHPRELLARVQNLLRRCQDASPKCSRFGTFQLDPERRKLLDAEGSEVILTLGEFNLLVALLEACGRVVSRVDLAELLSPQGSSIRGRSVDVLVSRLRQKLETDPRNPSLLLTVPGLGYRIQA